mgnify:CR=1 FL=1
MKRIEQKVEDTWCLEDMFESDDFWEEEFGRLQRMIFQYEDFEGTLGESADRLLEYLKFNDETNLLMERLYVYANMRYHQDMANSMYQEFAARAQKLMVEMSGASAFAEPEILEITTEKINVFFNENPELEGKVVVHHSVEQQVLTKPQTKGLFTYEEMHALENLRGIPKEINSDIHLSKIRKEWNRFYKEVPNPTKQQLLDKAAEIDSKFGHLFNPPLN